MRHFLPIKFVILFLIFLGFQMNGQTAGFNSSFAVLSINGGSNAYYDLQAVTGNPDFNGANLGNFTSSNSLLLKGAEHNVYKCGGCDLTSTRIYYRVYITGSTPSGFSNLNIGFSSGGGNGCGGQDQQWVNTGYATNILSGLTPGKYTFEVYSDASVTCLGGTIYAGNLGANYKASFNYCGPPTFTAVAPICAGGNLSALPTTSNNGFTGTWSPAINNTATTTYTFTPSAGQCATTTTLTITVNPIVTTIFTTIAPICAGGNLSALPTTSNNGIVGTWSPAINNTTTTTYMFTPTAGQCATTTTLTITVNPNVTPTFTAVVPICSGGSVSALPTTSNNGITGTWSPALDNTVTTFYTFTPDAGQCAAPTTLSITVNSIVTPTFTAVAAICSGGSLSALPTTSNNGITGTWSPALDNTATTTYTFTPDAGQCATTTTLTITVNSNVTYYSDNDGDGFGDASTTQISCAGTPSGYVTNSLDCNDNQPQYTDLDNDGFGALPLVACGVANNSDCNDNQIQYLDNDGDTFGSTTQVACGVANNLDCDDTIFSATNSCNSIVNLKLFIEGYYIGVGTMRPVLSNQGVGSSATDVESITVELREATTYSVIASTTAILQIDGSVSCVYPTAPNGSFYIAITSRNAVQTWSANPITVGATPATYDFSISDAQAYGNNLKEIITGEGIYGLFSGDINQDEVVDGSDSTNLVNDIENANYGSLSTDLNGDGVVDGSDSSFLINNTENAVFSSHP
jgi:hypothetical protein